MNWISKYLQPSVCNVCNYKWPKLLLTLFLCLLIFTPYLISETFYLDSFRYITSKYNNASAENTKRFLVWNPKCHIIARDSLDPSIRKFVKREKFDGCTERPLLTKIMKMPNGTSMLKIDAIAARAYIPVWCCWAPIDRLKFTKFPSPDIDSQIRVGTCTNFREEVILPGDVEVILVKCKNIQSRDDAEPVERGWNVRSEVYRNVHSLIKLEKVREKLGTKSSSDATRKLSVLILGIDTVSRLNFGRTMPKTRSHLKETGWIELQGYNKMADNTYPNLMALLAGLNSTQSYGRCAPTKTYGLDRCPFIWYNFRNASYVTAYGEDTTIFSTFNYLKLGFVDPPTDYYLRPYMIAAEKFLSKKTRSHNQHYCTGPELSAERIFNYAEEFAKTFIGTPYFGFFWTNSWTHDDLNGLSAVDDRILSMFRRLDLAGVLNDSMVIFLSDHGARYGPIRETFQGWYEDRLPFLYVWLPEWFRARDKGAAEALRTNVNRLASPFDLYETLRDVLTRTGGQAAPAEGCPRCQSIFRPIVVDRGCEDAGVRPHWCACTAFTPGNTQDTIAIRAVHKFVEHVNDVVREYKNARGKRLCAPLRLKKIFRVEENLNGVDSRDSPGTRVFLCLLQVTPGGGKFEVTIRYKPDGNFTISDDEVSRINIYGNSARCLSSGNKNYCHCLSKVT